MDSKVKEISDRIAEFTKSLLSLSGSSTADLFKELEFLRVVHPGVRDQLSMLEGRLRDLSSLASQTVSTLVSFPSDPLLEYRPAITDILDALLERVDDALNSRTSGMAAKQSRLPVRPPPRPLRQLQVEHDSKKICLPSTTCTFSNCPPFSKPAL